MGRSGTLGLQSGRSVLARTNYFWREVPRRSSVLALALISASLNIFTAYTVALAFVGPQVEAKEACNCLSMRLAWPPEREAMVEAVRTAETSGAEARPTVTLRARYQSRIQRADVGYEADVGDDDFTIDGQRDSDGDATAVVQGLVLYGRADSNGRLVEFFDIDALQARARTLYRQKFQGKAPEAELERGIALFTTRDVLQSFAARTWDTLVGDWAGMDFRVGVAQPKTVTIPLLAMDESYQLTGTVTVSDYEKCVPTLDTTNCVTLRFSAQADPAAVKRAIERGVQSFDRIVPFSADDTINVRFELELLTEPQTLTPYRARWTRELEVSSGTAGAKSVTTHKETTTFTFAYGGPAGGA